MRNSVIEIILVQVIDLRQEVEHPGVRLTAWLVGCWPGWLGVWLAWQTADRGVRGGLRTADRGVRGGPRTADRAFSRERRPRTAGGRGRDRAVARPETAHPLG